MKAIGFRAGSVGREGSIDRMVRAILEKRGRGVEFVKLTDLNDCGCKGCVSLCAKPQVCKLEEGVMPRCHAIASEHYLSVTEDDFSRALAGGGARGGALAGQKVVPQTLAPKRTT